jgi:pyridinium-3,5-bisthiocarboxylic acid mononucleotide nickel chelatase
VVRAHLHAEDGVTGEMLLGALVSAGASVERIEQSLRTLGGGAVKLAVAHVNRRDRTACRVRLHAPEETPPTGSYERVLDILAFAALPDPVRDCAVATFAGLSEALAASAGLAPTDLDLPEVGALDTIAIIVGVCAAIDDLDLDEITVGPIGVGSGTVVTFEGPLPEPAPAVRRLLAGYELRDRGVVDHQLVSPTGAALLRQVAAPAGAPPFADVSRSGFGAGDRDAPHEPCLRIDVAD